MNKTVVRLAFTVCLCLVPLASVSAQDDRQVGLTIGYPSAVGVSWQIADRIAIRADTSFSSSWTDAPTPETNAGLLQFFGSAASSSGHTLGAGVSVLVTVAKWERLRAYVAPRAAYGRSSTMSEFTLPAGLPGIPVRIPPTTLETRTSTWTYSGSFGTQYRLADRFAAFGEVGLAYASTRSPDGSTLVFGSSSSTSSILNSLGVTSSISAPSVRPRTNTVGIRSGAGVIFFF